MLVQVVFLPSFTTGFYIEYSDYNLMDPVIFAGSASLGVQLNDLHAEGERQELSRYIRIVFAMNRAGEDLAYYPGARCIDVVN
mmetsp:Transcript_2024/g.2765  ORF Transcript_2024/g.2765 Transcript_2024/m.2765 type:complete len:83 (-) Transcript_2024:119-367(-)